MTRQAGFLGAMVLALSACASGSPIGSTTPTTGQTAIPYSATPSVAEPSVEESVGAEPYPLADGEAWILFSAPASDPGEGGPHDAIFLVRPDGTGLHRLVHEMFGSELRATWSPDGSQVAYIQTTLDAGPGGGVFVVNADGSDAHLVYDCSTWCNTADYLDWGPDGAIYVGIDSNVPDADSPPLTFEIWRLDPVTGEGSAVLSREDGASVGQPRVSPDGTQLVYVRESASGWAIFVADMLGGPELQLTDWALQAAYPDWSADGLISFNSNDLRLLFEGRHDVYTVAPDGTGLQKLEAHDPAHPDTPVEAAHARWMPDGTAMTLSLLIGDPGPYASTGLYLATMNADGSDLRLVPGPVWGAFSEMRPV